MEKAERQLIFLFETTLSAAFLPSAHSYFLFQLYSRQLLTFGLFLRHRYLFVIPIQCVTAQQDSVHRLKAEVLFLCGPLAHLPKPIVDYSLLLYIVYYIFSRQCKQLKEDRAIDKMFYKQTNNTMMWIKIKRGRQRKQRDRFSFVLDEKGLQGERSLLHIWRPMGTSRASQKMSSPHHLQQKEQRFL